MEDEEENNDEFPEQEDKRAVERTPEATEFGQSEHAHEEKMLLHMNHSDNIFIGDPFKPLGRNENNI